MRFYRALLHLYPRSFRAEYGAEMEKDFAREWQASQGFGVTLVVTTVIDVIGNSFRVHADILSQDLNYAVRSLRRTPGFTITAIVVAAIGIGATTAAFSIADHVLIRPLPFPQSHRLMQVWEDHAARGYPRLEPSPPNVQDWQRVAKSFEQLEPLASASGALTGRGEAQRINGFSVGPRLFQMLGRQAAIGRVLAVADAQADSEPPIVISDRLWRTTFAANPDVLGQTMTIDGNPHVIVGVMPPDFFFPTRDANFWRILRFGGAGSGDTDRQNHYLAVIGRLKDGVTVEDARAEMKVIGADLARQYPKELEGTSIYLAPWRDQVAQQPRMLLLGLVGASVCVLLIACTNLANLLMSRALARRTEFAVRAAVGASVDRLVRQMLTDSLLLAFAGGAFGIALAVASAPLLARLVPNGLPIAEVPPLDLRMLASTIVLTTITGLAFGLLPALRVCRKSDGSALKEGARGGSGRGTERLRSALVVGEIVASIVLIVCAGLLGQALLAVQGVNPGFAAENLLTMRTQLPVAKYGRTDTRMRFYAEVLDRVQALPGVVGASYISFLPMTFRGGIWEVLSATPDQGSPGGFLPLDANHTHSASIRFVTPGFFGTLGTPIIKGRDVNAGDTLNAPFVAVVSESFARRLYGDENPIGRQFAIAFNARTIVGVAGDVKVRGLERQSEPQVYMPATQQNNLFFYAPKDLVIKASPPVTALAPAVRSIISEAEPGMPITAVQTMEEIVTSETAPRVVQLRVLGGFTAIALLLAAIGIHGLLAFTVASRSREIGVRIALGASSGDIMRIVIGRGIVLAALGVLIGVVLAYAAGRSMQTLLFGINPADVAAFGAAIALSLVMTVLGSLLPAWRAVRVDPISVTRAE
jgi:putative ABC transport system permease protein